MKARLLQKSKEEFAGGLIVETAVWELAEVTPDRPHRLKYRLFCGRSGECIVRYDNETVKVITGITELARKHITTLPLQGW